MLRTLAYAALWFLAGYLLCALANRILPLSLNPLQCGLLTLIIGLLPLLPILSTEQGRHLFYEGPQEDEEGEFWIGCLWLILFQLVLFALLGWAVWLILFLLDLPPN